LKIAFITNICSHYRVKTFETLARYYKDLDYYFFSAGDEWYWQKQHGAKSGKFCHQYLWGIDLGGTRFTPSLLFHLWKRDYEVYIKCITGRFVLPVTYFVARLRNKPFILWTGVWMRLQTKAHRVFYPFTRYIYRHADAIVVYGDHVKNYLVSEEGVPAKRIFVTTHAVDNEQYNLEVSEQEKYALRQELNIGPEQKIILYLGRLEENKGLPYLINAFALSKDTNSILVLAGAGSERVHLERLARENGIFDRVRFPGYIAIEKTVQYYATAWVFVLPSITMPTGKEPWGLVVNEAFNQGLPVIATDTVGAAAGGLIQDQVNGFVVRERDSESISQVLNIILNNPHLRSIMSQNARKIISIWDNEHMVLGFRDAIEYVTQDRECR
jgi:glycosyltransferase involved in cell wall biosynthesis